MRVEAVCSCMTLRTTLGRTAATVVVVTLTLTLAAGFLGALWRVTFWGAMGGHPMHASVHGPIAASPGFQLGFGVPLATVLVWALTVAVGVATLYLLYRLVVAPETRSGSGGTA
jgi:hypothetical protein